MKDHVLELWKKCLFWRVRTISELKVGPSINYWAIRTVDFCYPFLVNLVLFERVRMTKVEGGSSDTVTCSDKILSIIVANWNVAFFFFISWNKQKWVNS